VLTSLLCWALRPSWPPSKVTAIVHSISASVSPQQRLCLHHSWQPWARTAPGALGVPGFRPPPPRAALGSPCAKLLCAAPRAWCFCSTGWRRARPPGPGRPEHTWPAWSRRCWGGTWPGRQQAQGRLSTPGQGLAYARVETGRNRRGREGSTPARPQQAPAAQICRQRPQSLSSTGRALAAITPVLPGAHGEPAARRRCRWCRCPSERGLCGGGGRARPSRPLWWWQSHCTAHAPGVLPRHSPPSTASCPRPLPNLLLPGAGGAAVARARLGEALQGTGHLNPSSPARARQDGGF